MYSTDAAVGNVLRNWLATHPREDLFLTNKVDRKSINARAVEAAVSTSLSKLGVSYLDLYLMHCPFNDVPLEETWREMEALVVRFAKARPLSPACQSPRPASPWKP